MHVLNTQTLILLEFSTHHTCNVPFNHCTALWCRSYYYQQHNPTSQMMNPRFEELLLQQGPWTRYLRPTWHHLLRSDAFDYYSHHSQHPGPNEDYLTPNVTWAIAPSHPGVYLYLDGGHIWKHRGSQKERPPQLWRLGCVTTGSCLPGGMGESGDFLEDDTFFVVIGSHGAELISAE